MFVSYTKKQLLNYTKFLLASIALLSIGFAGYYALNIPFKALWSQNALFLVMLLVALTGFLWGIHKGEAANKKKQVGWFLAALVLLIVVKLFISSLLLHTSAYVLSLSSLLGLYLLLLASPVVKQYIQLKKKDKTVG